VRTVSAPAIVIVLAGVMLELSGGCETKIVDLVVPADMSSDGAGGSGGGIGGTSGGFGGIGGIGGGIGGDIGGSSGAGGSDDSGVGDGQMCTVVPNADTRCVNCFSATSKSSTCLKCDAPVKTSDANDYCRPCGWDGVMGRCLQCFAADGTATLDDCDALLKAMTPDGGQ
jgi:hypothetical protein